MRPTTASLQRVVEQRSAALRADQLQQVQRVPQLSNNEFLEFASNSIPVVITASAGQSPIGQLTLAQLRDEWGELPINPRVGDYVAKALSADRDKEKMLLREYLDLIAHPDPDWDLPPYMGNHDLPPSLCERVTAPTLYPNGAYGEPRLWLGPAGTITPLHSDLTDNVFVQVLGRKRFTLYPPHDADKLYTWQASNEVAGCRFNPDTPDFETFPLARNATRIDCEVGPGEILFLPGLWFHHVVAVELSLSVNFFVEKIRPLAAFPPGTTLWDE